MCCVMGGPGEGLSAGMASLVPAREVRFLSGDHRCHSPSCHPQQVVAAAGKRGALPPRRRVPCSRVPLGEVASCGDQKLLPGTVRIRRRRKDEASFSLVADGRGREMRKSLSVKRKVS